MFCVFCGKKIRDEALFCPFCGRPVSSETARTEEPALSQQPAPIEEETLRPDTSASPREEMLHLDMPPAPREEMLHLDTPPAPKEEMQPSDVSPAPREEIPREESEDDLREEAPSAEAEAAVPQGPFRPDLTAADKTPPPARRPFQRPADADRDAAPGRASRNSGPAPRERDRRPARAERRAAKPVRTPSKRTGAPNAARKRRERKAFRGTYAASKVALLLAVAALFLPYCRIAYSAERAADMPLWKLIAGGEFVMGASNPLVFTLKAHPTLALLVAAPLALGLLTACFKRTRARLPIVSGLLLAGGAGEIYLNMTVLRAIRTVVTGLSLETFRQQVVSMNGVLIRWIQSEIAGKQAFEDVFEITGHLGFGLLLVFGGLLALLGLIGFIRGAAVLAVRSDEACDEEDEDDEAYDDEAEDDEANDEDDEAYDEDEDDEPVLRGRRR